MMQFIAQGGPLMAVLLAAAAAIIVIFIERLFYYRRAEINANDFITGIAAMLRRGAGEEALRESSQTPGPVARIVVAIVARRTASRAELDTVAADSIRIEMPSLDTNRTLLQTLVYLVPLVGLLGAALGLYRAFQTVLIQGGNATILDIATTISGSLFVAIAALVITLPAYALHCYLTARQHRLLVEMERSALIALTALDDFRRAAHEPK